jgi:hypothetical protein
MPQVDHDIPLALEETPGDYQPRADNRPRIPEPLPVKLIAVEDVTMVAPAGIAPKLDDFYAGLFGFERLPRESELLYRAENLQLRFDVRDKPVVHDSMRPQGIEVASLAEAELKLIEAEIEYTRQRGVTPGQESLVLLDPAGNWIEVLEMRVIV